MRIVLDTGILVRANAKSRGPAREVLLAIVSGPHELIISPFLLNETERVLRYPRLLVRHGLTDLEIAEHVEYLRQVSELVDAVVREPVVLSDPDDDPVVYTAVDGQADVLCTLDRDLFQPNVTTFCREKNIAVMTDVELLRILVPRVPAVD
ncbi:MAG: putative toxin-antitoxin system toxin component, PIN family [Acidobacteria bacterium]|nr:putative toxin-antitoxin system toxin component, PIN family [Planctomycetota bacterium]MBI3683313.1 putative toxin-antitoxin system toxin component, PIN family [Acidobacteriota bacterium]